MKSLKRKIRSARQRKSNERIFRRNTIVMATGQFSQGEVIQMLVVFTSEIGKFWKQLNQVQVFSSKIGVQIVRGKPQVHTDLQCPETILGSVRRGLSSM